MSENISDRKNNLDQSPSHRHQTYDRKKDDSHQSYNSDDKYEYYRVPKSKKPEEKKLPEKLEEPKKVTEKSIADIGGGSMPDVCNSILGENETIGRPLGLRF